MDNRDVVNVIESTIALLELHEYDPRKVKSYGNAIFNLERLGTKLREMSDDEILKINGVGPSIAKSIREILDTGTLALYEDLKKDTKPGLLELLGIRGIGAGKVRLAWQELNIDSVDAMLVAIRSGELEQLKGFGKKTVVNLYESLSFFVENKGKMLLPEALEIATEIETALIGQNKDIKISRTGDIRLNRGIVERAGFLLNDSKEVREAVNNLENFSPNPAISGPYANRGKYHEKDVEFRFCESEEHSFHLFKETGSEKHFELLESKGIQVSELEPGDFNEEKIYSQLSMSAVPPEMREGMVEFEATLDNLVKVDDLRGVLHAHSTYSDGRSTLREMAQACIDRGFEYLGITDHSKSAFYYANGMYENRVLDQHKEIDELNAELAPFKIFKGIESDILTDGELDYELEFLQNFDFVVASVHSVLNMDREKATQRILNAVENPFTTIMGHLTGRVLLQRKGLPLDHKAIIDACVKNDVIIEINAHPARLDLDWRWVAYGLEKGLMLSINPDAHSIPGIEDMQWGVISGRKGGLTKDRTLNAMGVKEISEYFEKRLATKKAKL